LQQKTELFLKTNKNKQGVNYFRLEQTKEGLRFKDAKREGTTKDKVKLDGIETASMHRLLSSLLNNLLR
jgi:hypothetical protein